MYGHNRVVDEIIDDCQPQKWSIVAAIFIIAVIHIAQTILFNLLHSDDVML